MRLLFLLLYVVFLVNPVGSQNINFNIENLLSKPHQYTILRTKEKMQIDGKDNEEAWSKAPWTEMFTDIVSGKEEGASTNTRCKMLWDNDFLYLYAELDELNIWASVKEHDQAVYQDNAFEMFLDIEGDGYDYYEFQINAFGTVWDLFMPRPYRNGGHGLSSWDIKGLKKAVYLNGTINNPSDTDKSWSVELAIPFKSVCMSAKQQPAIGTIWRMNFSRVEWDCDTIKGKYVRKRDSNGKLSDAHYLVWSPQGIVNLHYPERWGYVQFSDHLSPSSFLSAGEEDMKLILWKYYYLQKDFKNRYGRYASTIEQLNKTYLKEPVVGKIDLKMEATEHQFWIQCFSPLLNRWLSINQSGEIKQENSNNQGS